MSAGTVQVPLRNGSDGDASHRPTNLAIKPASDARYLEILGTKWMNERGEAMAGISYVLQRLPAGYAVYEKARPGNPTHVDKWLYGHPGHKIFDSPNRFYPHFKFMMENSGNTMGCQCTVCVGKARNRGARNSRSPTNVSRTASGSGTPSNTTSGTSSPAVVQAVAPNVNTAKPKGRPKLMGPGLDTSRVDEEGTPDVYRNLINKLKKNTVLDEDINEPLSLDWRAEQEDLPRLKERLSKYPSWVPRAGEIVLFIRKFPKESSTLSRDRKTGHFKLYDVDTKTTLGYPIWEAGYVALAPSDKEEVSIDDVVDDTDKTWSVAYSGIRVEPLPDPNSDDKSQSKRYVLAPLKRVRPFIFYKEFLAHQPLEEWHPTIRNALMSMFTFSMLDKYRFKGTWPEAWIYSTGLYLGSELLAVGDTVRLLPKPESSDTCTDIMVIKTIRMRLTNLHLASDSDYDGGRPYNTSLYVFGKGYTRDQTRSSKEWLAPDERVPTVTQSYGPWHPLQPAEKEMMVPMSRILGRLYEAEAMTLWLPELTDEDGGFSRCSIDQGREGLLEARDYAKRNDQRTITEFGSQWFWADNRVQALDLETVNGIEVGKYAERDPSKARAIAGKLNQAEKAEELAAGKATEGHRSLRTFMAPPQTVLPVRRGSTVMSEERRDSGSATTSTTTSGSSAGIKGKKHVIDLSDDEDEDEHHKRRFLTKGPSPNKRGPMVVVSK